MAKPRTWISLYEVAQRMKRAPPVAKRVVEAAGIRVRTLPGERPEYHADDLARVLAESEGVSTVFIPIGSLGAEPCSAA